MTDLEKRVAAALLEWRETASNPPSIETIIGIVQQLDEEGRSQVYLFARRWLAGRQS